MLRAIASTEDDSVALEGQQGTTWSLELQFFEDAAQTIPKNLAGFLGRGQYRKDYKSTSPALLDFVCTVRDIDPITNPDNNKLLIELAADTSSAVTQKTGVYDIEIYNGVTAVERILWGTLTITPEVTRPL